jgi:hypothetical protein
MGFAVFSWQIPVSKEVMCLILLNHVLTFRVFACMGLGGPRSRSLCWGNDGMIWLWSARSDVTVGLVEKITGGYAPSLARLLKN